MRLEMKPMTDTQREMLARIDVQGAMLIALARSAAATSPDVAAALTRELTKLMDRTGPSSYVGYLQKHLADGFEQTHLPQPREVRKPKIRRSA